MNSNISISANRQTVADTNDAAVYRIVHVVTRFLRAGSEENTVASCEYQLACGHEVYLVHGNEFDPEYARELDPRIKRIKVPELVHPINPLSDTRGVLALRKVYRRIEPHIVHTHQSKAGILGRLAAFRGNAAIVHSVHIAHWLNVGWVRQKFFVVMERFCSHIAHELIDVSEGVRDACLVQGIGTSDQHHVIHSGMNIKKFRQYAGVPEWQRLVGPWPGQDKPFVVLMLAAFEPRKRHEPFLRSMAPVLSRHPEMCLVFCGEGVRLEPSRQLARELGIQDQVRFAGYIDNPEDYVALADLCVLVSEREGLPRVLVQYVAGGRPVVVNHLAGVEIIVQSGSNGIVLSGDDLDGTALEIESLSKDPEKLHAMSVAAAQMDVSSWDVSQMGEKIQMVYEKAMASTAIA